MSALATIAPCASPFVAQTACCSRNGIVHVVLAGRQQSALRCQAAAHDGGAPAAAAAPLAAASVSTANPYGTSANTAVFIVSTRCIFGRVATFPVPVPAPSADSVNAPAPDACVPSRITRSDIDPVSAVDQPCSDAAGFLELGGGLLQPSSNVNVARCTAAVGAMVAAWAAQQHPLRKCSGAAAAAHGPPMQLGTVALPMARSPATPASADPLVALRAPVPRPQRPDSEVSSIVLATRLRLARPRPLRRIIPGTRA